MDLNQKARDLCTLHCGAKEYLTLFKQLLPMMATDYTWNKCEELIDFFYKKLIPHFDSEEEIFQHILNEKPGRQVMKIILKIQKEHLEILENFEMFAQKVRSAQSLDKNEQIELTFKGISIIDAILEHADYEDKNLMPLLSCSCNPSETSPVS